MRRTKDTVRQKVLQGRLGGRADNIPFSGFLKETFFAPDTACNSETTKPVDSG